MALLTGYVQSVDKSSIEIKERSRIFQIIFTWVGKTSWDTLDCI